MYIASIYCAKKLSKYEALRTGIDHIADLLNGDEATVGINDARAVKPDRILKGRGNIFVKRRSAGECAIAMELGADAIKRKNTITEIME